MSFFFSKVYAVKGLTSQFSELNMHLLIILQVETISKSFIVVGENESHLWSGGADSNLICWKDITEEEKKEQEELANNRILEEQQLSNLLLNKKYTKALNIAINLQQPHRTLKIIKGKKTLLEKSVSNLKDCIFF